MKLKKYFRGLTVLFLLSLIPGFLQAGDLKIVIFSVNSGDSQLIIFPNNKTMLIDTGIPDRTDDTVIPFMQRHGITHLDYFLGTHIHPDHTDGIPNLEAAGYIDAATVVWGWTDFDMYDSFMVEGTDWFLYNVRDTSYNGTDANANSVSWRMEWNGFIYSGSGDENTGSMDRFLNDYPALVPAHVRNTAHHGWGPNSTAFLNALNADLYIVSGSTSVMSVNNGYKRIESAANSLGADLILTATANNGSRGHTYIRVGSGSDWEYSTHHINNSIANFYTPPQNDSKYISQTVPETLMPGETANVSVTFENTGPATWSTVAGHKLGSRSPDNNTTWTGASRVNLPHDVAPGEQVTFNFDITAPTSIDFYDFQWQMIDEDEPDPLLRWFGSSTPKIPLDVTWPLVNLVQNPSFELDADSNSRPDNWGNDADYSRSNLEASDGNYSARGSGSGGIGGISQTIAIDPNTEYELSVDIFYASGSGTVAFDTQDKFDAQGTQTTLSAPNGGWTRYKSTFNSGVETSVKLRTYTSGLTNGVFYVDNVTLTTRGLYVIPNLPPEFTSSPNLYAVTGTQYSYSISTSDPDNDPVNLTVTDKPSWLNLSGNVLSGTPTSPQTVSVTLRAADSLGHNEQTFTITVSNPGNDAPIITSIPNTGVIEGVPYGYEIIANDPDGDSLTYTLPTKPSWLSISGNLISGTPPNGDVVESVIVSVSDGTLSVTQQFNIAVFLTPQPANLFQNGSFEDGSGWPTAWSNDSGAVWSTADAHTGSRSLLIPTDIGNVSQSVTVTGGKTYDISIWVNAAGYNGAGVAVFDSWDTYDGAGEAQFVIDAVADADGWTQKTGSFTAATSGTVQFRIFSNAAFNGDVYFDDIVLSTAGSGNATPVITSVPNTNVDPDSVYSYTLTAADAEVGTLTFATVSVPGWLTLDNGVLSGTPTVANQGDHAVSLSVTDAQGASGLQNFTVTVNPPANLAPSWNNNPVTKSSGQDSVAYSDSLSGNASDPDGDALLFSKVSGPAWLTVAANGSLSGTPDTASVGLNSFIVSVSDGVNAAVNATLNITVDAAPDPYEDWKAVNGISNDNADNDNDGIPNIIEFALSGDPNSADADAKSPTVSRNGATIDFSFHRGQESVTYRIEKSTDLVTWTDHTTVNDSHGVVGGSCTVPVSVSEMSNGKLFLRLMVEN